MRKLYLVLASSLAVLAVAASCGDSGTDDDNDSNFTLTLTAGSNGTVAASPSGTSFAAGTDVTLTASPSPGFKVLAWTGTDNDASVSPVNHVTMSASKTVNVTFTAVSSASFTLTLSPGANGAINASPTGPTYTDGTTVTLTAVPGVGFKLGSWTGTNNDASTSNTNTVTMTANRTVSATFVVQPVQKTLTLHLDQDNTPGSWGVTATPPGTTYHQNSQTIQYDAGTVVTLTAVDAPSWPFLGWSGDIGSANPHDCSIEVTMDVDRSITASIPLDGSSPSDCD